MTHYDTKRWEQAHKRFIEDPKTVTDEDLDQFAAVDPKFSEHARAKRAGFVKARTAMEQAAGNQPARMNDLLWTVTDVIDPLLGTYRYKSDETRELIVALETRLSALEQKPFVKFVGVFEQGKSYVPGDAVTHSGGLWICRAETTGQPNQDFHAWKLAVKSRSIT
jgi:hypothetical protein